MQRYPVDLRGVAAFVAVLDGGSVAVAATALGWSHPTVDHHLRKLELAAGVPLLRRGPRGSAPTEAGERFEPAARRLLQASRGVFDELDVWRRTGSTLVRLGVFPTLGAELVPALLRGLAGGEVELEVTLDECERLTAQLAAGSLDVAIVFQASGAPVPLPDSAVGELLFAEDVFLAVAADRPEPDAPTPLRDLAPFAADRWSFGASGSDTLDDATRELCLRSGFEPETGMHSDDYPAVLRLVAAGVVVAVVPATAARAEGVRFIPVARDVLRREVVVATGRDALGPGARGAAIAALRRELPAALPGAARRTAG